MPSPIDKKTLEHLARLARLELQPEEEEALLKDLQSILNYFEELKALDTSSIHPMSGGTKLTNVFREDELSLTNREKGVEGFPEKEEELLKVPPVFGESRS